ncbi:MAG: LytTR family DNA-binding domain-containing protein [Roseburia sp.]|nr:LytTR family DNA-binding domain-containing protein [Roseburia sp.]MCM1097134.1 LytTR family DNA-binding domain-containing protein [Ruminococcus flavefaciens]
MYKIGICDDGKNICASIEDMLLDYAEERSFQVEVLVWYTGEYLKEYLEQENHLDILFLDIELLQMTGIEVGSYIRNVLDNVRLQIIYISGKTSYALRLFRTQPVDFLVKPISREQVVRAMDLAVKMIEKRGERFEFRQGRDYYYIAVGDIVYLESRGRKIRIVTLKGSYEIYGRLKEAAERLPGDFILIHQSYIVNQGYIFRYAYESVELINGVTLTISKPYHRQVREKLLRDG